MMDCSSEEGEGCTWEREGWTWEGGWLCPVVCAKSGVIDKEAAAVSAIVRMARRMGCFIRLIYINRSFAVRIRTVANPLII